MTAASALLSAPKEFTTENTKNHGESRKLFETKYCSFFAAVESSGRMPVARTVAGPVSPCNSVVLRVLRGKFLKYQSPTPTRQSTQGRAATTATT
jgi:hypothetical protein